jgi:hypothetical protein
MLTEYEIENVILADEYTKARKLAMLKKINTNSEQEVALVQKVKEKILNTETEEQVMEKAELEDRIHWIEFYANRVAADLLTLGKVQPENMLSLSLIPEKDFVEVVKKATGKANRLNKITIETEKDLNLDLISNELI